MIPDQKECMEILEEHKVVAHIIEHSKTVAKVAVFLAKELKKTGEEFDCFSILRHTNPFRSPKTIKRAWEKFKEYRNADSLRAIEKCSEHPAKMWIIKDDRMIPLMSNPDVKGTPWHSMPYQALPEIYVQNASLEIAYTRVPLEKGSIAGDIIIPFITEGLEGFDINFPEDLILAKHYVTYGIVTLPEIHISGE